MLISAVHKDLATVGLPTVGWRRVDHSACSLILEQPGAVCVHV